jgi:hypothetical protein
MEAGDINVVEDGDTITIPIVVIIMNSRCSFANLVSNFMKKERCKEKEKVEKVPEWFLPFLVLLF